MVYWFPQGFISSECTFPCVRGTRFSKFFRVHLAVSSLYCILEVHGLLVSLGFHSPGNSLFHVSEVRSFAASSWFHSPVSILSHLSEVHCFLVPHGFISSEYTFPCVRVSWFTGFIRVSFTTEFTSPCFRGAWFTGIFRVSFTREFAIPCVRGVCFAASSWFHSPVSVLSRLSEVHCLLVSSGFQLQ